MLTNGNYEFGNITISVLCVLNNFWIFSGIEPVAKRPKVEKKRATNGKVKQEHDEYGKDHAMSVILIIIIIHY